MKKLFFLAAILAVNFVFAVGAGAQIQNVNVSSANPFAVYIDNGSRLNHFAPSGWIGDFGDIRYSQNSPDAYSGTSCIKITYDAKGSRGAKWAGIYWQYPDGNWGQINKGYNLTGATRLTFWAKGETGREKIATFKIGGITGEFSDSDEASIGPITLGKDWRMYSINLKGKDLSRISGGFCIAFSKDDNPNGFVIYLDDIMYQ